MKSLYRVAGDLQLSITFHYHSPPRFVNGRRVMAPPRHRSIDWYLYRIIIDYLSNERVALTLSTMCRDNRKCPAHSARPSGNMAYFKPTH